MPAAKLGKKIGGDSRPGDGSEERSEPSAISPQAQSGTDRELGSPPLAGGRPGAPASVSVYSGAIVPHVVGSSPAREFVRREEPYPVISTHRYSRRLRSLELIRTL